MCEELSKVNLDLEHETVLGCWNDFEKYRCHCQCAFITITFYNQNNNTLIFKNTLCIIDSRKN